MSRDPIPGIPAAVACPSCGGYVRGHQWIGSGTCSVVGLFDEPVTYPAVTTAVLVQYAYSLGGNTRRMAELTGIPNDTVADLLLHPLIVDDVSRETSPEIVTRAPLPPALMGITDYRRWERFALEIRVRESVVIVNVVELVSLAKTELHATTVVLIPGRSNRTGATE